MATGLAVSGDEGIDCIGQQIGDQEIPINSFSNGQESNLGIIVNQYGQLMGEYSRLDDELWFSKPEDDDETMADSNERLNLNFLPTYGRAVDLEKPSTYVDNSISERGTAFAKESSFSLKDSSLDESQTSSPISVLQRRRSYSNVMRRAIMRARSKRNRPVRCNSRKGVQSLATAFFAMEQSESSQRGNLMESLVMDEVIEPIPGKHVRTKKISELLQSGSGEMNQNVEPKLIPNQKLAKKAIKKCLHCDSTKTPQWREGPLGPATLCNACGVQFRKGRLFPEYRPLASPTYDPSYPEPKMIPKQKLTKAVKKCLQCESTNTPQWREGPMGPATLCNACGVQFRNGRLFPEHRPVNSPTYDPSYPEPKLIPKQKLTKKAIKKCLHCDSTKTPQWREGPMGRRTLCNACGVQFRHGRLFSEYRPLNSPTYNPSLHSHLPKKVEQMRMSKSTEKCATSDNSGQPV